MAIDPDVDLLHAVRARLAAQGHSVTHTYQVIVKEVDAERRRPALTVMTLTLLPATPPATSTLAARSASPADVASKLSATQRTILSALIEAGPLKGDKLVEKCGFKGWSSLQGRNGQKGIKALVDDKLVINGEDGYELTEAGLATAEQL